MQLAWWAGTAESVLVCAGAVVEWALALYVLTRGGWQRVPVLTALAIASLVVYQLGIGMVGVASDFETQSAWLRQTWPGPALLPALWLVLTAALAAEEGPEAYRAALRRLSTAAAIFALGLGLFFASGVFTDLVRHWEPIFSPTDGTLRFSTPGPFYPAYVAFILICALWAAANAVLLWRTSALGTPLRARWRSLLLTAVLFLAAGGYLAAASSDLYWNGIPGDALLIVGMLVLGWGIARYGALVAGEVVAEDFAAFVLSMLAVVGGYGIILWVLLPHDFAAFERALPLLLILMATHVLASRQSLWIERLVYGPVRGTLRDQLRLLAGRVVRQPDPISAIVEVRESVADLVRQQGAQGVPLQPMRALPSAGQGPDASSAERGSAPADPIEAAPAEFRVLAEGALRRLNDLPALSQHPLLDVLVPASAATTGVAVAVGASSPTGISDEVTAEPTALERAKGLRDTLVAAIARLRPPGARPLPGAHGGSGGWLHFLVLHEAYVEGRPNKEIMQRYSLSEGTFHRARRRAIDVLALDLYQRGQG